MTAMDFQSSQNANPDRKSLQSQDERYGVLGDGILDPTSPRMSPSVKLRRESAPETSSSFVPSEEAWAAFHFGAEGGDMNSSNGSTHDFIHPRAPTFTTPPVSQTGHYSLQPAWPPTGTSGSCTPTPGFEQLVEFNNGRSMSFHEPSQHVPHHQGYDDLQLETCHSFQPNAAFPTSPQSSKGGWVSASSSDGVEFQPGGLQARSHTPPFSASGHLLRRDGIRKKNARFEIPAERNLRTIDQLINQTNDEQEIKELKQQKRLLRNRQAALDSRQRKKQHTERLEEEKKHYTAVISELEDALGEMKVQEAEWARAKDNWAASQQQYQQYIDTLVMEKEELVRRYTIESGELRKKNALLLEQLQRMDGTAMSTAPSSAGFTAEYSDFDHLTMNGWDDFSIPNEFSIETHPRPEHSVAVAPKPGNDNEPLRDEDKALTSGFLLMLLLCGAWVASTNSTASANLLPAIPDDFRAASATVLNNLYKDSGISLENPPSSKQHFSSKVKLNALARTPKVSLGMLDVPSISHSPLDSLHRHLATPSEQQIREQAFSLTPTQYNEISSEGPYPPHPSEHESQRPRNVGDALAAIQAGSEGPAAASYTRSLMRDKISTEVLQDFARMIKESKMRSEIQWKPEPLT